MTKRSLDDKVDEVFNGSKRANFGVIRSDNVVIGDDNDTSQAPRATSPVNTTADSIIPSGADSGFIPRQGSSFENLHGENPKPQNPETACMPAIMKRQDRSYVECNSPESESSNDENSTSPFDANAGSSDVARPAIGSSSGAGVSSQNTTFETHQKRAQVIVVNDPKDPFTALDRFGDLRIDSFRAIRNESAQSASQGEQLGSSRPVLPQGERPSGSDNLFDLSGLSALLEYRGSPDLPAGSPTNSQAEKELRSGVNSPSQE